jgi:hypothetical protein
MIKKSARKASLPGGVQKSGDVRVKAGLVEYTGSLSGEVAPRKISKLKNVKKMRSIVGDSSEQISQLLESNETDQAVSLMYKRMLQTLLDLLSYSEQYVRKTKAAKGVYQVNALISNIRELMTDIQSAQDRGMLGDAMIERILQPSFREIGSQFVQEFATLESDIRTITNASIQTGNALTKEDQKEIKKEILETRGHLASVMQTQYEDMKMQIVQFLQR